MLKESGVLLLHERWDNKWGPKIKFVKKLILVISLLSISLFFGLASYGTVSNGKGINRRTAIKILIFLCSNILIWILTWLWVNVSQPQISTSLHDEIMCWNFYQKGAIFSQKPKNWFS